LKDLEAPLLLVAEGEVDDFEALAGVVVLETLLAVLEPGVEVGGGAEPDISDWTVELN
jgi:hypothetical protein